MNGFGSHIELFEKIFEYKEVKTLLEFGMGDFSTPYFIENVKDEVTSIEMQTHEWFDKTYEQFKDISKWNGIKCIGQFEFMRLKIYKDVDVVLVDGHGNSRPECINFISEYTDTIVAHDTEPNPAANYRWDRVNLADDFEKIVYTKSRPWTTIWTRDRGLYSYLKNNI